MRFASERGEASYYTCHKMDNCVSASYVINEIIMVIYGKINSSYSFKGLIFCLGDYIQLYTTNVPNYFYI